MYSSTPTEGIRFSRSEEGQFAQFSRKEGVYHTEIFPVGSRGANENNKEKGKNKNLPRQFIFEDIKLERLMASVLKTHLNAPRLMN